MKRTLLIVLSVAMVLCLLPSVTFPAAAETSGYYTYTVSDGEAKIKDVDTSISGDIVIPDELAGYPVTSIGEDAFKNCTGLTSITIPNSITSIAEAAFFGCSGLTSITIPFVGGNREVSSDTYQHPFGYIFGTSSYTGGVATKQYYYGLNNSVITYDTYYIPENLKSVIVTGDAILYCAFYNCSGLTSITIPSSVTSIGNEAFYGCSGLTSITIPDSVTSIGGSAFSYCTGLTSIALPDSITSIGGGVFYYCTGLMNFTIPDGVTSIGYNALAHCTSLTSITIPSSVTSIGEKAFLHCTGLTSITIPDSVTSIGKWAFFCCSGLASISIPDSVTSISENAFYGCADLTSITIPDSVTNIGDSAFHNCTSLTDVWYTGDEECYSAITFGSSNECLTNATWHYNYNPCDDYINVSGATIKTDADIDNQGMRYEVKVGDAEAMADVSEVGILLIPQSYLGSAELTVDTAATVKLATVRGDSNWDAIIADGGFQATLLKSTIQGRQNWEIVSRAYTVLTNGEVLYGETSVKSVTSVALAIANTAKSNGASTTDEIETLLARETLSDTEISKMLTFCRENIQYL
ncbi:MAG: leucine-rich repeat domain-containing protein [Clostridia bacterium]|nr:leucine-rich repeat domain-containing protein [Clostridia bacterium]